jgi:hypothetical protein
MDCMSEFLGIQEQHVIPERGMDEGMSRDNTGLFLTGC